VRKCYSSAGAGAGARRESFASQIETWGGRATGQEERWEGWGEWNGCDGGGGGL
jgi:hypothetical protein